MSKIEEALEKATKMREERREESHKTESTQGKEHHTPLNKPSKTHLAMFFVTTFMVALIGTFFYLTGIEGKKIKSPIKSAEIKSSTKNNQQLKKTMTFIGNVYEGEVTRLTKDFLKDLHGSTRITDKELSKNEFYSIQLKAIPDCIHEDSLKTVFDNVSVIKDGKYLKPIELNTLNDMKKIIYKGKACGEQSGIVYVHFYIACSKKMNPEGLFIDGKEILF